MADIITTLSLDITQVRSAVSQLASDMNTYRAAIEDVRKQNRAAFGDSDFIRGVREANNLYREQAGILKELEQYEKTLLAARRQSSSPEQFQRINAELARTRAAMVEINRVGGDGLRTYIETQAAQRNINESLASRASKLKELLRYEEQLAKASRRNPANAAFSEELNSVRQQIAELRATSGGALDAFNASVGSSNPILNMFGGGLVKVAGYAAAAVAALSPLAKASVETAMKFEDNRIAFESMLQSKFQADKLQADLVSLAAKSPFEIAEIGEVTKRLIAYGFTAKEIIPNLTALGNISAGVGKEKLPQLILAFGQVRAATKLTGNELRQFTEAGVPLLNELSIVLNKPVREVQKLIGESKVSFQDVQKALMSLSSEGGRFANLMERQSQTLSGAYSNMKDNITTKVLLPLGETFSSVLKPIVSAVNSFFKDTTDISVMATKSLFTLQSEMNNQVNSLIANKTATDNLRISKEAEEKIRIALNKNMKEVGIPLAFTEKTTAEQYAAALKTINEQLDLKIKKTVIDSKLTLLRDKEFEIIMNQSKAATEYQKNQIQFEKQMRKERKISISGINANYDDYSAISSLESSKKKMQELNAELAAVRNEMDAVKSAAEKWGVSLVNTNEEVVKSSGLTAEEIEKAAKKREQQLQKAEDAEIKLMQMRLSFMNESKEKEVYSEKIKNRQMEIELERMNRAKTISEKVFNELSAKNKEEFEKVKVEIQDKYDNQLLKTRFEARNAEAEIDRKAFESEMAFRKSRAEAIAVESERLVAAAEIERDILINKKKEEGATLQEIVRIYDDYSTKISKIRKSAADEEIKRLKDISLIQVDRLKAEFDAEQASQRQIFFSKVRSAQDIKKFEKNESEAKKKFDIALRIERLKIELETARMLSDSNEKASKERIAVLKANLKEAQSELGTDSENTNFFSSIAADFGIDEDGIKALKYGFGEAKKAAESFLQYRLDAANRSVEVAKRETDSRRRLLEAEFEIARQGYANDLTLRQQQLQDAIKAERDAINIQREAAAERQAIETASQAVSLASAIANIYKSTSALGALGVIIAAGLTYKIFADFNKAKVRAAEESRRIYRDGGGGFIDSNGIARGLSHEKGGIPIEIEGDEAFHLGTDGGRTRFAVVNKKMTAKHFELLSAINADDKEKMANALSSLVGKKESPVFVASGDLLVAAEMKKNNDYWRKYLNRETVVAVDGKVITIGKNTTSIVKS